MVPPMPELVSIPAPMPVSPADEPQTEPTDSAQPAAGEPAYIEPPSDSADLRPSKSATTPSAPRPVGTEPASGDPFFGTWVLPRGLRGALTAGFGGSTSVFDGQPNTGDQSAIWSAEVSGTVGVLDERIFSLDYTAGIESFRADTTTADANNRNALKVTNLGLSANIMSGRTAPLRVFASRSSAANDTRASVGGSPETLQDSTGTHSALGVAWDLNANGLPKIHASATTNSDSQVRNYLFGQSQWNTERRAEVRVTDTSERLDYDASYQYDQYDLSIPEVALETETTQHLFTGALRAEPTPKWLFTLDGHASRYLLGRNRRNGRTSGLGVGASARYAATDRVFASVSYSLATNLFEAFLSGQRDASDPELALPGSGLLTNRVKADNFEARTGYVRTQASVEVFARSFSLGAPLIGPATLSSQRTVGARVQANGDALGFRLTGTAQAEFGTAFSTRDTSEPYQAGEGSLSVSRDAGRAVRLSVDGSVRQASRLTFYIVPLASRSIGAHIDTQLPAWARISASVSRNSILRDAIYGDYNDRFTAWSAGVSGPRYGVTFDANNADAESLLISPELLNRRVDLALILDRPPGFMGDFTAYEARSQRLTAHFEPKPRLQIWAFGQQETRRNYGLYDQKIRGAQVSVVYALRQVQIEAGWNKYETWSTLAAGPYSNQRYYFKIRRDITIF